jgi:thimet oligopeptidase
MRGLCLLIVLVQVSILGAATTASSRGSSVVRPTLVDWNLSPSQIRSSCALSIAKARTALGRLASRESPSTFANTLLPLESANADLTDELVAQTFLWQVSPDRKTRDASLDCVNEVAAFNADTTANPAIYRRLRSVPSSSVRSDADRALLKFWLAAYRRSGAGLPEPKRKQFVALSKQLTILQNEYTRNLGNDTTSIPVSKVATAGLPAEFLASLKQTTNGDVTLPINDSTISIIYTNARSAELRRRAYLAFTNIQVPQNLDLLTGAIRIRYRLARLLGFPNWAAYQMADRVVTQPEKIERFLEDLDQHLKPQAVANVAELRTLKVSETGDPNATIEPWDIPYYVNELQKTQYAVDRNEIRQYFPAPHVVTAVLAIYQHLLGVTISPVTPANNWNPDVTEYAVSDTASERFIGTFLLDLYPRDGKPGGAFNAPILPVRRMPDGSWRPPISAIVVSTWPAPLAGKPALLTHDDVTTFFHEFGHCMAALLTTAPYESVTEFGQDFVEAPSQMLENFTWNRDVLKALSANVETGMPLPDGLIDRMIAARCTSDRLCNAYAATRQIMYSDVDLAYHDGGPNVHPSQVWDDIAARDTPIGNPPGAHPAAQFSHLMGGYDASYYVYLWSLVYAQDMFTAFQKGGIDNASVGMRYRKAILEPALTYGADREVKAFLGRPMSPAAFYAGFDTANKR